MSTIEETKTNSKANSNALLLGTGLALASLILLPAVATRMGLGSSLTGALRIALMKASYRAGGASAEEGSSTPPTFSCH
jgi:hypothetical protein